MHCIQLSCSVVCQVQTLSQQSCAVTNYLAACVIVSYKLSMQICHYFIMFLLHADILTLITYLIYSTVQDFLVFHLFDLTLLASLLIFENISHWLSIVITCSLSCSSIYGRFISADCFVKWNKCLTAISNWKASQF